jgi:radical SAM superfamily enzyme YgiQ (UPF0313 family)
MTSALQAAVPDFAPKILPTMLDQFYRSITLVIPPSSFLLDERVFVSLGVLKVAAALERKGIHVNLLDLSGIANYLDALETYARKTQDTVIGITATTPQLPAVALIAQRLRAVRGDLRLVLGGPHVTLTYAAVKLENKFGRTSFGRATKAAKQLEDMFDVLVAGDGELAVFSAITLVQPPKVVDGDDMKGGFFMNDEIYTRTPEPARHLVDLKSYKYSVESFPATSLIAQLGCPFNCGFCGGRNSKSLRVIRTRPTKAIVDEVERLYLDYGYTGYMFYDDELNVNKSMVELMNALTDLQMKHGVEFRLRGFVKSELFTDAQAEAMYRAGFRWLLCGFEAANPRILENIEKRASLDDNTRAVEIAKRHNLKIKALMSVGHPGESAQSIQDIEDWLIKMQVDDFDCTVITTYPGTPYYDLAVPHESQKGVWTFTQSRHGDRLHSYEVDFMTTPEYYKGDPNGGYRAFVFTDHLSSEEIVARRNKLETRVRDVLNIPFNPGRAAMRFEHSMGQGLPDFILRNTAAQGAAE